MKRIITISLLIIFAINSFAESNNNVELYKKANTLYTNGKYEDAISLYKKIVKSGEIAPELYYNMGNAYYRSNNFTEAVYYYEKAKMLAPGDKDIEANIKMVNLQIFDKIKPMPEFFVSRITRNIIRSQSSGFWGGFSIVAFILFLSAGLFYLFSKIRTLKIVSFIFGITLFVFSVTTFIFAKQQNYYQTSQKTAIVFSPSVSVKSEPGDGAKELFVIHEGLKVEIQKTSNDWCEIRLADGKEGWLRKNDMKVL